MIVQKVFGITQISEGTAFEYRIIQFFLYLGIVGYTILWFLCMFLWPLYYMYRLYRFLKYDERMGGDEEGYYPWGVRYGVVWNTLIFIGFYVIMPFKIVETSDKERAERERIRKPKTEQIYVTPYKPSDSFSNNHTSAGIDENNLSSYSLYDTKADRISGSDKELEYFEEHLDDYYDNPEDGLMYPDEILDFNKD